MLETGLTQGMATRAPVQMSEIRNEMRRNEWWDFAKWRLFDSQCEQTGAACRNRAWMIASPRMAAAPDDRLALLTGENQLLERLAQGEELESILDGVCRMVEGIFRDSFVSIMLVNPDDHRLWYAASGSLPPAYTEALNGLEVGPSQGSCGAAAYRNAPVIVDDVVSDPLWVQYRDVAAQFGLRSCWSTPIRSADGRVVGTFAVLSRQPGTPTPHHQRVVAEVTHLASIAIAHKRNEDRPATESAGASTGHRRDSSAHRRDESGRPDPLCERIGSRIDGPQPR